jgi:hypothetical protein
MKIIFLCNRSQEKTKKKNLQRGMTQSSTGHQDYQDQQCIVAKPYWIKLIKSKKIRSIKIETSKSLITELETSSESKCTTPFPRKKKMSSQVLSWVSKPQIASELLARSISLSKMSTLFTEQNYTLLWSQTLKLWNMGQTT